MIRIASVQTFSDITTWLFPECFLVFEAFESKNSLSTKIFIASDTLLLSSIYLIVTLNHYEMIESSVMIRTKSRLLLIIDKSSDKLSPDERRLANLNQPSTLYGL